MLRHGINANPDFLAREHTTHLPLVDAELELERIDAAECQQEIALFDGGADSLTKVRCQDDTRGRRSNRRGRNLFVEEAELLPECLPANTMESLIGGVAMACRESGLTLRRSNRSGGGGTVAGQLRRPQDG
jgi:hypothetical protein